MNNQSAMIIDDNGDDRYLLKRVLKKAGFQSKVFEAENGQVALDMFHNEEELMKEFPDSFPPKIIFLDINMPIMGGFEFLDHFNELKRQKDNLHTVVFAMFTSSERKEDVEKATAYDFVHGVVTKGNLTPDGLKVMIKEKFPDVIFEAE